MNIKKFVEDNPTLVTRRESTRYPGLFVLKYHKRVFWKNLWTPELQEMRGLVVDADYNIVIHPFTKVYNRFENDTDIPLDEEVTAVRKVNGFMAAMTNVEGYGTIVSTTGSLDSDFAKLAETYLLPFSREVPDDAMCYLNKKITYIFEICDPSDPHIVPEEAGAYLIGARNLNSGEMLSEHVLDKVAVRDGWKRPETITGKTFGEIVDMTNSCNHEGFMVHGKDTYLKMKSPHYLMLKLFARMSEKKFQTDWLDSQQAREWVDEEYYPMLDYVSANRETFHGLAEQDRLQFLMEFLAYGNTTA